MAFGNPILGGTVLVRPAIKSPNYVPGVSGWSINRDGSAEFDDLTIRGTFDGTDYEINSSGEFFYSGTPAFGNLVMSIANAAGTDSHGNPYAGPGVAIYSSGGTGVQMILSGTEAKLQFPSGYSLEAQIARLETSVPGSFIQMFMAGPSITTAGHTDQAYWEMTSSDGTASAACQFSYSDIAGNPHLFAQWNAAGFTIESGSITAVDPATGTLAAPAVPETWHALPALQNGWTDRHGVQATYPVSSYQLDATGQLRMALYLVAGAIANNTLLFTLPTAYVPAHTHIVAVETDKSGAGADSASGTPCIIIRGALEPSPGQVTVGNFNTLATRINQGNISVPMSL